jgi:hypothetical protein
MSKRKPATKSKHSHSPKIAAKTQRAAQAIVRSPRDSRLRSLGAGSTESSLKHNDPKREALLVENLATTALQTEAPPKHNDPKQKALIVEIPATTEADCKQTMMDKGSREALDFSLAATNVWAYQAKLLEMAQANMQFAFDFAQRLATIRSPVEFPSVIAEFTYKRIAMFHKVFDRNC